MIKTIIISVILSFSFVSVSHAQNNNKKQHSKKDEKNKKNDDVVIMDFSDDSNKKDESPFPDVVTKGKL